MPEQELPPQGSPSPWIQGPLSEPERERLAHLLSVLVALDVLFGALFLLTALRWGDLRMGFLAAAVALMGAPLYRARRRLDEGEPRAAMMGLGHAILGFSVVSALILPSLAAAMVLLLVVAGLLVLPFAQGTALRRFLALSGLAALPVAAAPALIPPPPDTPPGVLAALGAATLLAALGFLGFLLVHARRRLEERTAEADAERSRLRLALESLQHPVLLTDKAGRIQLLNAAARDLLPLAAVGEPLAAHLSLRAGPGGDLLAPADARPLELPADAVAMLPDGRQLEIAGMLTPLGGGEGLALALRDATFERALQMLRIERATLLATSASAELLASFAHDIRTPLHALLGFVDLLCEDPGQSYLLPDLHQASSHLRHLAEQYLDYAQVEHRRFDLHPVRLDLAAAVQESIALLPPHDLRIRVEIPPAVSFAILDETRLKQVFINLLSNAVRHTPPGGAITVRCAPTDSEHLRFTVEDTGEGFPPEVAAGLFAPFTRHPSERSGKGAGLGLSIVQRLVEAMGGTVQAWSAPGQGARFTFVLPRDLRAVLPRTPRSQPADSPGVDTLTLLRRTVESLDESVEISNAAGHLLYVNPAFERLTGYAAREALGRTPAQLLRSNVHPTAFFDEIWDVISGGRTWRGRMVSRHRDGHLLHQDTVISPVRDVSGAITHFVALKRDVSQELDLESRLRQVERLISGVAHQLNNPLTAIIGDLTLLQEYAAAAPPDAAREAAELITDIRDSAWRMRDIVRSLRALSQPERGGLDAVDVRPLLDAAVEVIAPLAADRARIVTRYEPLPLVRASRAGLAQLFQHLLASACQAIPPGSPGQHEIRISAAPGAAGEVLVSIIDTGAGLEMGLPLASSLARQCGGTLVLEPATDGSVARLILAAIPPPAASAASLAGIALPAPDPSQGARERGEAVTASPSLIPAPASPPADPPGPRPGRLRVLSIDDEKLILKLVRNGLRAHDVTSCASATEALPRLLAEDWDVVLCDMMMPGMNGMELHARVCAARPELASRFVFATGGATLPEVTDFLARVRPRTLHKPFSISELQGAIASFAP